MGQETRDFRWDPTPETHLTGETRDPRPGTLKVESETRDLHTFVFGNLTSNQFLTDFLNRGYNVQFTPHLLHISCVGNTFTPYTFDQG